MQWNPSNVINLQNVNNAITSKSNDDIRIIRNAVLKNP